MTGRSGTQAGPGSPRYVPCGRLNDLGDCRSGRHAAAGAHRLAAGVHACATIAMPVASVLSWLWMADLVTSNAGNDYYFFVEAAERWQQTGTRTGSNS